MVKQYPYAGKAIVTGDSVKVGSSWIEAEPTTILETKCRVEPARSSQYLQGQDGKSITYNSIVYMPIPSVDLKPGTLFEVWDGEKLIVREMVKQYSRGQLNARVWL